MSKLNLMIHCGGEVVGREVIEKCATPLPTYSHVPVPHSKLIDLTVGEFSKHGYEVVNEAHGINKLQGDVPMQYFGVFQLKQKAVVPYGDEGLNKIYLREKDNYMIPRQQDTVDVSGNDSSEYDLVVGLRNSHDKAFPASIALGSGVFVCDNLAFSGEVNLSRKHTRYIMRDLPQVVARGVVKLTDIRCNQDLRLDAYHGTGLSTQQAHDIVIQLLDAKAMPNASIQHVLEEYRRPKYEEFKPRTAWSLFNCVTEVAKRWKNPHKTLERTQLLHGVMDRVCGINNRGRVIETTVV